MDESEIIFQIERVNVWMNCGSIGGIMPVYKFAHSVKFATIKAIMAFMGFVDSHGWCGVDLMAMVYTYGYTMAYSVHQ